LSDNTLNNVAVLNFKSGKEVSIGQEKLLDSTGLTPAFQVARRDFFNELVAERPDYDATQLSLMERVSYLHARLKQKESQGAYSSEQNYTIANKTYLDTLALLRKTDAEKEDREKFQRDFMSNVAEAVKYAVKDLDEETQKQVLFLLSKKWEEVLGG
jgi:hypothetical protein